MARRPQNLFEVLGQAGQVGFGQIGAQFAAGQQQERQNALQSFFAIMKQQEFEQESEQRAQRVQLSRIKMLQATETLKQSQMTPEMKAQQEQQRLDATLTGLGAATSQAPRLPLPISERIESLNLPPGAELSLPGGIDFTQPDPLAAEQAKANLAATQALTTQRLTPTAPGPPGGDVSSTSIFNQAFDLLSGKLETKRKKQGVLADKLAAVTGESPRSVRLRTSLESQIAKIDTETAQLQQDFLSNLETSMGDIRGVVGRVFDQGQQTLPEVQPIQVPPVSDQVVGSPITPTPQQNAWGKARFPDWDQATNEDKMAVINLEFER